MDFPIGERCAFAPGARRLPLMPSAARGGCRRLIEAKGDSLEMILLWNVLLGTYVSNAKISRSTYSPVGSCATLLNRMVPAGPVASPDAASRGHLRAATSSLTCAGTSAQVNPNSEPGAAVLGCPPRTDQAV